MSEHADIINFVANGSIGDEEDIEDLPEDSPVEPEDSKGSESDDPAEPEESDKPEEFSPEFVEMVQNSMDRIEEINYLLDEKRYQEAKKLYRTTLVPLVANDAFREKYPDGLRRKPKRRKPRAGMRIDTQTRDGIPPRWCSR